MAKNPKFGVADTPEQEFLRRCRHEGLLRLVFEGDSWFARPLVKNLAEQVLALVRPAHAWLNLAVSGDDITLMGELPQSARLARVLRRAAQIGSGREIRPIDYLFLSGGGNDIVGDDLPPLMKRAEPGQEAHPGSWFHSDKLVARLDEIVNAYDRFRRLRDENGYEFPIIVHGYDHPVRIGIPARVLGLKFGPWFRAAQRRYDIGDERMRLIAAWLIDSFNERLIAWAQSQANVHYVDLRGTLAGRDPAGVEQLWADEIHPGSEGFGMMALRVRDVLMGRAVTPSLF